MDRDKKKPIKIRFKELTNGRKAIYLYSYINGVNHREYLHLYIRPEVDKVAVRENKRAIAEAEKVLKERLQQLKVSTEVSATTTQSRRAARMEQVAQQAEGMLLTDWLTEFYDMQKRCGKRHLHGYTDLSRLITQFNPAIRLKEIDKEFCRGFISFLLSDYRMKNGNSIKQRTAYVHVGTLTTALNAAVNHGLMTDNPMSKLTSSERIKYIEVPRNFLTIEELKRLIATPCDRPEIKRAYLFACFTGLRISDIKSLKWRNISTDERGWVLSTVMQKSTKPVYIPLGYRGKAMVA